LAETEGFSIIPHLFSKASPGYCGYSPLYENKF